MDHLLFRCPITIVTWCWLRNSLGWLRIPASIEIFLGVLLEQRQWKQKQALMVCNSWSGLGFVENEK